MHCSYDFCVVEGVCFYLKKLLAGVEGEVGTAVSLIFRWIALPVGERATATCSPFRIPPVLFTPAILG